MHIHQGSKLAFFDVTEFRQDILATVHELFTNTRMATGRDSIRVFVAAFVDGKPPTYR